MGQNQIQSDTLMTPWFLRMICTSGVLLEFKHVLNMLCVQLGQFMDWIFTAESISSRRR